MKWLEERRWRDGPRGEMAQVEIQIHPADIRKSVRYLFLSRREVIGWMVGVAAFFVFLVGSLALVPNVVGDLLRSREYRSLEAQRAQQGRRLKALVERIGELEPRSKELRVETQRLYLAYGLSSDESIGQGGYPLPEGAAGEPEEDRQTSAVGPASGRDSIYRSLIERGRTLIDQSGQELAVIDAFSREVADFQTAYESQVLSTPSIIPLPRDSFVLTSPYGERTSPFTQTRETHSGIDMAAQQGTPIHATGDGMVVFAGRFPLRQSVGWWRYGNLVVLRHDDSFITLYGHCDEVLVKPHQRVQRGDVIATVGSTGWSTNPHLHYEVRRKVGEDFRPVDPRIYILDHRWDDQERLLIQARSAPRLANYEPLPRLLTR